MIMNIWTYSTRGYQFSTSANGFQRKPKTANRFRTLRSPGIYCDSLVLFAGQLKLVLFSITPPVCRFSAISRSDLGVCTGKDVSECRIYDSLKKRFLSVPDLSTVAIIYRRTSLCCNFVASSLRFRFCKVRFTMIDALIGFCLFYCNPYVKFLKYNSSKQSLLK